MTGAQRFTLSLPVTAAVCPGHAELVWWACDVAQDLAPLTEEEMASGGAGFAPIFPLQAEL